MIHNREAAVGRFAIQKSLQSGRRETLHLAGAEFCDDVELNSVLGRALRGPLPLAPVERQEHLVHELADEHWSDAIPVRAYDFSQS